MRTQSRGKHNQSGIHETVFINASCFHCGNLHKCTSIIVYFIAVILMFHSSFVTEYVKLVLFQKFYQNVLVEQTTLL